MPKSETFSAKRSCRRFLGWKFQYHERMESHIRFESPTRLKHPELDINQCATSISNDFMIPLTIAFAWQSAVAAETRELPFKSPAEGMRFTGGAADSVFGRCGSAG